MNPGKPRAPTGKSGERTSFFSRTARRTSRSAGISVIFWIGPHFHILVSGKNTCFDLAQELTIKHGPIYSTRERQALPRAAQDGKGRSRMSKDLKAAYRGAAEGKWRGRQDRRGLGRLSWRLLSFQLVVRCRLLAQSGHGVLHCTCLLLTQSGHRGRFPASEGTAGAP